MLPERRDAALLMDMLQFAAELRVIVERAKPNDYLEDIGSRRGIERCIELIGEAADHLSEPFNRRIRRFRGTRSSRSAIG